MDEINGLAKQHGLFVLEDAAQAWGARMSTQSGQKSCGALADMGAFSFFPSKNLGAAGEGGLITTDNDELAAHAQMLRVHGQSRRYYHDEIGYNSRLHAMQAAILGVKLPHSDEWNDRRRANAARYKELLGDLPISFPDERPGCRHVYHQYTIRVSNRQPICDALTAANVGWAIYYPVPLHRQNVYHCLDYDESSLPEAERAALEVISLPIFPELRSDELEQVAAAVRSAF
jgi:dTDP-4-amino-4,6-dideoxygalactose transaminase